MNPTKLLHKLASADLMLDVALQNLWRKKLRSVLTIMGIAVCANLFITVTSIANFLVGDVHKQADSFAGQVIVQARGEYLDNGVEWPPLSSSVSQDEVAALQARPDVVPECSSGALFVGLSPALYPGAPPEVLAVGIEPGREAAVLHGAKLTKGAGRFTPGAQDEVILGIIAGRALASSASSTFSMNTKAGRFILPAIGSTITIRGEQLKVIGLAGADNNQLFRSMMVLPLATAQRLFNRQGTLSAAVITPQRPSEAAAIAAEIESQHPDLNAVTDKELKRTAHLMVAQQQRFMDVLRATAVVAAAVIVSIVMFVAVLERTRELGTMRAIGAPALTILVMIVVESLILMVSGIVAGIPISVVSLNNSFKDGSYLNDHNVWAASTALLLATGLLASLLPAWRASRVDPVVAIRYE